MKESDNNVKLIVLDRLTALKDVKVHERVLQVKLIINLALSPERPLFLCMQDLLIFVCAGFTGFCACRVY